MLSLPSTSWQPFSVITQWRPLVGFIEWACGKWCITHYLRFEHIGVQFLCSAGLLKVGNSRNPSAAVMIKAEWDKFINEESLSGFVDPLTKLVSQIRDTTSSISEKKQDLEHRPIDQIKGEQIKKMKIVDHQCKYQQQLSDMLVLLRSDESTPMEQWGKPPIWVRGGRESAIR